MQEGYIQTQPWNCHFRFTVTVISEITPELLQASVAEGAKLLSYIPHLYLYWIGLLVPLDTFTGFYYCKLHPGETVLRFS